MSGEIPEAELEKAKDAGKAEAGDLNAHNEQGEPVRGKLAAEAFKKPQDLKFLSTTELVKAETAPGLSVESRQGIANFAGTLSAGISGTMAWSIIDKSLGSTRYGLAAKLAGSALVGGLTRVAGKGGSEMLLLDAKDRTTGLHDLAWGGVDALAAVGAVKAEEAFSNAWKVSLGKSSGAHLSHDMLLDQGRKILEGHLGKRITHNTLRGIVGGSTGALLWSSPHELATNFNKLNTLDGWKETGTNIGLQTLAGGVFGGVLFGGGTALWNARDLAGMSKAAILGKQGRYSLDVHHFNDGHSSILGDRSSIAQLAGKADELRQASQKSPVSSVLLDMGDAHSGNAAAVVSNTGELEQRIIHAHMKVNASIPGNHSADTGFYGKGTDAKQWILNMKGLSSELAGSGREVPGIAANVRSVLDPELMSAQGIYKPYRVFVDPKSGDKVGIVGLVTDQLQGATAPLVDMKLAAASAKFGNLTLKELSEQMSSNPEARNFYVRLTETATALKMPLENPGARVSDAIEALVNKNTQGLSAQAQAQMQSWYALAGKHPEASLGELVQAYPLNKNLADLASQFPNKRISDLRQFMVSDPLKALESSVAALKTEGIDKVIVMSHLGKSYDMHLAKAGPKVAAFFGGHSHHLEPVPVFVKNAASGSDIFVGQAGSSYGWLGEANLVFNKDGSLNRYLTSSKLHVIDETVKPMQSVTDHVMKHMQSTEAGRELVQQAGLYHPVSLQSEIPLDFIRGQQGRQTPLANLIASAFKDGGDKIMPQVNESRKALGLAPLVSESVDAVLLQSGGIRQGLPAGQLDDLTLQSMFLNQAAVVEMTGSQIQKALSYGVHDLPAANARPRTLLEKTKELFAAFKRTSHPLAEFDASGKNLIAGELRYNVDRSLPSHSRVSGVEIFDRAKNAYVPLDPNKKYTVMTVSHLIKRFAETPLIKASDARGLSFESLGPEYWVLGKSMPTASARQMLGTVDLNTQSSRNFMLDYLRANSNANRIFKMPASLNSSPLTDLSPGSWVPGLRPSVPASATIAALSAGRREK